LEPKLSALQVANAAGHTWIALDDSHSGDPSVVVVDVPGVGTGQALADVAADEEMLAEGLASLAAEGLLAVVDGPADARDSSVTQLIAQANEAGAEVVLHDHAERITLRGALDVVGDHPEFTLLLLAGDSAMPAASGPGQVFHDLIGSSICPVVTASAPPVRSVLQELRGAVREGRLIGSRDDDRSFVAVRVADLAEAQLRVNQLLTTSIPRAFAQTAERIGVVVLDNPEAMWLNAIQDSLSDAQLPAKVTAVADVGTESWLACVVVISPQSLESLSRADFLAALASGGSHISLVHTGDPALTRAVRDTVRVPRQTRLAGLLREVMADAGA